MITDKFNVYYNTYLLRHCPNYSCTGVTQYRDELFCMHHFEIQNVDKTFLKPGSINDS